VETEQPITLRAEQAEQTVVVAAVEEDTLLAMAVLVVTVGLVLCLSKFQIRVPQRLVVA
jgi:hypothetical protein